MSRIKNTFKKLGAGLSLVGMLAGPVNALANEPIVFGNKINAPIEHKLTEVPKPKLDFNYEPNTSEYNVQGHEKKESKLKTGLSIFGAFVTEYYLLHEGGHMIGEWVSGADRKFKDLITCEADFEGNPSDSQLKTTIASGFVLPMAVSEALLDSNVSKDNTYVKWLIRAPFLHNLAYVIKDIFYNKSREIGDFQTLEEAGWEREITYPLSLLIPAIQFYRSFKKKDNKKENPKYNFSISPVPRGDGLIAKFDYRF